MFADVHSHLLYALDDGARSAEESRALLSRLHQNGVTHLALTPHYYPYRRSVSSFLQRRAEAFEAFSALPETKDFTFALGAEVYLSETLLNNEDLSVLCYGKTNLMLTETEYSSVFTDSTRFLLLRLTQDYGIRPVLAHIDRYPYLWRNEACLRDLEEMGCLFQINFSALTSYWKRRRALQLYRKGLVHFVGEDVHREVVSRSLREKVLNKMEQSCPDVGKRLAENARRLIFEA